MRRHLVAGLALVAVALSGTTLWLLFGGSGDPSGPVVIGPESSSGNEVPGAPPTRTVEARIESQPIKEAPSAGESFLAEYWGKDWPRKRQRYLDAGLGENLVGPAPPPWEDVAEKIRDFAFDLTAERRENLEAQLYAWGDDKEWIQVRFSPDAELTDMAYFGVLHAIADMNEDLLVKANQYLDALNFAMHETWSTGRYEKAPIANSVSDDPGLITDAIYSRGTGADGWTVRYVLRREEWPLLGEMWDECRALRKLRDRTALTYVRSQR